MPEIAEIRIMSEYINRYCLDKIFYKATKNPVHKNKTDLSYFSSIPSKFIAMARGKELQLMLYEDTTLLCKPLTFTMGMSGNWKFITDENEAPSHTHLKFYCDSGILCMHDVRRFARWDWRDWNLERGPDPIRDHKEFRKNILNNRNHKDLRKPIFEVMMDQKYFNGIGNYLRSSIIYHLEINPMNLLGDLQEKQINKLLDYCKEFPEFFYRNNGGQLYSWINPDNKEKQDLSKFLFYRQGNKIIDKKGRTFWYNPKYDYTMNHYNTPKQKI